MFFGSLYGTFYRPIGCPQSSRKVLVEDKRRMQNEKFCNSQLFSYNYCSADQNAALEMRDYATEFKLQNVIVHLNVPQVSALQ